MNYYWHWCLHFTIPFRHLQPPSKPSVPYDISRLSHPKSSITFPINKPAPSLIGLRRRNIFPSYWLELVLGINYFTNSQSQEDRLPANDTEVIKLREGFFSGNINLITFEEKFSFSECVLNSKKVVPVSYSRWELIQMRLKIDLMFVPTFLHPEINWWEFLWTKNIIYQKLK